MSVLLLTACGADIQPRQADDEQNAVFTITDTVWSAGALDGAEHEVFGQVKDAAVDEYGNVYILDGSIKTVRVFDREGRYVYSFGNPGNGPGELADPRAVVHDQAGHLYVLDRLNGLIELTTGRGQPGAHRTVTLEDNPRATSMCISGDDFLVYAHSADGAILHRYGPDGDLVDSFGEPFGEPAGHPIQRYFSRIGQIACIEDRIFVTTEELPVVRAYRRDGQLLWTDTLPNFIQPFIQLNVEGQAPGTFAIGVPPGTKDGRDYNLRLRTAGKDLVLAQSIRTPDATAEEPDPHDITSTCLIRVAGTCGERDTSKPQVLTISGGVGVVLEEDLYPIVKLVKINWYNSN